MAGFADQLAEAVAQLAGLRESAVATSDFDVIVSVGAGVDPVAYGVAGATWWLPDLEPEAVTVDAVRGVLRDGPFR